MSQSDFQRRFSEAERSFAAGSVRGIRTWKVDRRAAMQLPTKQFVDYAVPRIDELVASMRFTTHLVGNAGSDWIPGENTAECRVEAIWDGNTCAGMDPSCTCGFYAYWKVSGIDPFPNILGPKVAGVIEGWGKVTIGAKGFRCEKAKILAVAPWKQGRVDAETLAYVAEAYPDVATFESVDAMLAEFPTDDPPEGYEDDEPDEGSVFAQLAGTTVHVSVNMQAFQRSLQQARWSMANAYAIPPSMLTKFDPGGLVNPASDDPPQTEKDKRQAALDAVRKRNTGPRWNPFRRRGKGQP